MADMTLSVTRDLHDRERALDWLTALFPVLLMALIQYRWAAVLLTLPAVAGYLAVAVLFRRLDMLRAPVLPGLVSGLLVAFCLPAGAPLWVPAVAGIVAALTALLPEAVARRWPEIPYAQPVLQPALVGALLVWAVFPATLKAAFAMPVQWAEAGAEPVTSLAGLWEPAAALPPVRLFFGVYAGAVGQACSPVLLLAAAYLLLRRRLRLIAPGCMLAVVALLSWIIWGAPLYGVLAGGTLFAALLLADRAVAPAHYGTQAAVGVLAGGIAVLLRAVTHTDGMAAGVLVACLFLPVYPLLGRLCLWLGRRGWALLGVLRRKIEKMQKNQKNS